MTLNRSMEYSDVFCTLLR